MPTSPRIALGLAAWVIAGCASLSATSPPPRSIAAADCAPRVLERIYFGLSNADGPIAAGAWQAFVERAVTMRFPSGFTVIDANGQWRDRDGHVGREASRIVEIVHDDTAAPARLVEEIVAAYKREFRQEAVLVVRQPVTACF